MFRVLFSLAGFFTSFFICLVPFPANAQATMPDAEGYKVYGGSGLRVYSENRKVSFEIVSQSFDECVGLAAGASAIEDICARLRTH